MSPAQVKKLALNDRVILDSGSEVKVLTVVGAGGQRSVECLVGYASGIRKWKKPAQIRGKVIVSQSPGKEEPMRNRTYIDPPEEEKQPEPQPE